MTTPQMRQRNVRHETGIALISVLMLAMMALILTGALATVMLSGMNGTRLARAGEVTRGLAEAGIGATVFRIEAGTNPGTGAIPIEKYLSDRLGVQTVAGNPRAGSFQYSGTLSNGSWVVTLTDPAAADGIFTLTSVGTDTNGQKRTLVATVRAQPPSALNYAMFGNRIEFHNHNKANYGLTLNTTLFSNGSILIDKGVRILGLAQAVSAVRPNTGPAQSTAGVSNTVLIPAGQQGDANPMAGVSQVVPGPPVQAFPTFDFYTAQTTAAAAGRQMTSAQFNTLLDHAQTCASAAAADGTARSPGYPMAPAACSPATVYSGTGVTAANVPIEIVHYLTTAGSPHPRDIAVPNAVTVAGQAAYVPLGALPPVAPATVVAPPATGTNLFEIRIVGDPTGPSQSPPADNLLYLSTALVLDRPATTLVQVQGSLVVNGAVTIHAASEFLAWQNRVGPKFVDVAAGKSLYTDDVTGNSTVATTTAQANDPANWDVVYSNWPAIAANGNLKVDNSSASNGGPVHIEGAVYSVSESHFHKDNLDESSYLVGAEIADTIHNCQWFSFAYDPRAKQTLGFSDKTAGRAKLQVIRLEDRR